MKVRLIIRVTKALIKIACLSLSLCLLSTQAVKLKHKQPMNLPINAQIQYLSQQNIQQPNQGQLLIQQVSNPIMNQQNNLNNAAVQPFMIQQVTQPNQLSQQQPQQQQQVFQNQQAPNSYMVIKSGQFVPGTVYMGSVQLKPQSTINQMQSMPNSYQNQNYQGNINQHNQFQQPVMDLNTNRNFAQVKVSSGQKAKFDFNDMVKDVVGGLQDAARGANEAIDEAEQKAEAEKQKWDQDVCTQFCTEIEGYEGQGVVRNECPDRCMENHPDWKKQQEIDMDVQQAADAAKKALCLNPDGSSIPDCTPQVAQTSEPNKLQPVINNSVNQMSSTASSKYPLVKVAPNDQTQEQSQQQMQVPVIIIKEWISAPQTANQPQQPILNQQSNLPFQATNFMHVQKQPQIYSQSNTIQPQVQSNSQFQQKQSNPVPIQVVNTQQYNQIPNLRNQQFQTNKQLPVQQLRQNSQIISPIQNFLQMNKGNQAIQYKSQMQPTQAISKQLRKNPTQMQQALQVTNQFSKQNVVQQPVQNQIKQQNDFKLISDQNMNQGVSQQAVPLAQQSSTNEMSSQSSSISQTSAQGSFNCKEWLKSQPIEAQREIEQKAQQQLQQQIQIIQQSTGQSQQAGNTVNQMNQIAAAQNINVANSANQAQSINIENQNQMQSLNNVQKQVSNFVELQQQSVSPQSDQLIEQDVSQESIQQTASDNQQIGNQNSATQDDSVPKKNTNSVNSAQLMQLNKMFSKHSSKQQMLTNIDQLDQVDQFEALNSLK